MPLSGFDAAINKAGGARALMSGAFVAGFAVATWITVAAAARVAAGGAPDSTASNFVLLGLGANLLIIAALAATVGRRVIRLILARGMDNRGPAPRLHLRFVGWFSLVAIVPAIVVAVLLGALFARGMESWFSEQTGEVVQTTESIAKSYVNSETTTIKNEVVAMAGDLAGGAEILREAPIEYTKYLIRQAEYRGFPAAYVVDEAGAVLARAEARGAPGYAAPPVGAFVTAEQGDLWIRADEENDVFRALFKLTEPERSYIYIIRPADEGLFGNLAAASASVTAFRAARAHRGRLQLLFALLYFETAALVVIAAIWLGLAAANRIVEPIGALARAAERVRDGDLTARVDAWEGRDELALLSGAFNEMTEQLADQREELVMSKEIAEERRKFTETVLAGVTAGVVGVAPSGRLTIANASAEDLLRPDGERSIIGDEIAMCAPEFADIIQDARQADGRVVEGEAEIERAGRVRKMNVRAATDAGGSGVVVATFADITRLVAAQRNAAWQDVARRIAHEIKNPLTPIQLSAERIRRKYRRDIETDREVFDRCVDTIVRQVADIRRMVDEFSSYARMPEPRPERINLNELVQEAAFAQRVANPDIQFSVTSDAKTAWVMVDGRLVSQALTNILKNAAEAVSARTLRPDGESDGRVDVAVRVVEGAVVVEVADNGVGWPAAPRERLLEPYMTTREKGTGLGLAIVRRVIEDHQGRLELDDRSDGLNGAVVRCVLPLENAPEGAALAAAE